MREIIILWFIILCILLVFVVAFVWRYQSRKNKIATQKFVSKYNAEELGIFKCSVDKNLLSFANPNYVFNSVTIFKIENGFLLSPTIDYVFKIKLQLKPFIISNKFGEFESIDVNKIEKLQEVNNSVFIRISAKYNTLLILQIFNINKSLLDFQLDEVQ